MSDYKICRICLRTECKVYKYDQYQLKPYYEEVMALKMNLSDGLPHYFCYECAVMLHKFHKFKEKCYNGQNILKDIAWRIAISYEIIHKVDREANNLKSNLGILKVTERVKTYCINEDEDISESDVESFRYNNEKEEQVEDAVNYMSEDSILDTKDDLVSIEDSIIKSDAEMDVPLSHIEKLKNNMAKKFSNDKPDSPKTVFVDVKKEVITLKSERIKRRRKHYVERVVRNQKAAFPRRRTRFLDTKNWQKSLLTEEEAIKEFRKRAEDLKYIAAKYKCVHCFKWFRKENILKRHNFLRHTESVGNLECRFCHTRFKWDSQLRKHMRMHFTKYRCLRCDLVCNAENTVTMHEEYHNGVIKKCFHCGEEFKHTTTYYSHLRTHRSDYVCTLCGSSFVSPLGLHLHKKVKHITEDIEESSSDDDIDVNTYCEKCDIRFETRKAFKEHLFHSAMHTEGVEGELDEITIPRKVLGKKLQAKVTNNMKGRLVTLSKMDDNGPALRKGRKKKFTRMRKKPTTCHQCGKHFDTQAACMKHHLQEHPRTSFFAPNQRHICEICGASLAPGSVAVHLNIHTREKVHPCETCGKTFHSNVGLKRHLVTHTGEKPFKCNMCDKRFTQSNSMKLHYRTIHLKQPYPKRNRRKKKDDPPIMGGGGSSSGGSENEARVAMPHRESQNLHYLQLP